MVSYYLDLNKSSLLLAVDSMFIVCMHMQTAEMHADLKATI